MDLGIRGKKAIIAGGSAGLGGASARALAREGVDLVIAARTEPRLSRAAADIADKTGVKVTPVQADHSTVEGRAAILDACREPDILVITCTPPPETGDYRSIDVDQWNTAFAVSTLGPIELMRAVIPGMVERQFGRIVCIGTAAAKNPLQFRLLSGAPRAALVNYIVAVSKGVARHNVAINSILPGLFDTEGAVEWFRPRCEKNGTTYEEEIKKFTEDMRIPAMAFGDPEQAGAMCAFLCSRYASYTTGQSLVMDGGLINSMF